ncbi:hypothetical protein NGRA_0164 [Nosema granulosis]|uniref:Folate transporter n=1 Tax=Nosema granulosis TaxID=83296 RepID=A0A9P6H2H6_9MICR|nr:hypothetical protein NGRA_0164 [Nosema granulosis]
MSWSTIIYIFYMAKTFTPFLSFMVPYLIDSCKFTNKEVYNKLNPFFFISSLIVSLLSFWIIETFGNKISLFIDTALEILVYIIFFVRPEKSYLMGIIVCSLHGASTAMNSVLKNIIISTAPDKDVSRRVMTNTQTLKNIVSIFSSWIGQDVYIYSREHRVNIFYSLLALCVSLSVVLLLPSGTNLKKDDAMLTFSSSFRDIKNYMGEAYDRNTVSYSLIYICSSILSICLSFFAASIFMERKKKADGNILRLNNISISLMKPFRWVSFYLVRLYSFLGGATNIPKDADNDIVIHGYVDGLAKMVSALLSFGITKINFTEEYLPIVSMSLNMGTMMSLYLLSVVDSLAFSYLFFIISFSLSSASKVLVVLLLYKNERKSFIISFNMFVSSFIHIFLSYLSLYLNSGVQTRFLLYFTVSVLLVSASIVIYNK